MVRCFLRSLCSGTLSICPPLEFGFVFCGHRVTTALESCARGKAAECEDMAVDKEEDYNSKVKSEVKPKSP